MCPLQSTSAGRNRGSTYILADEEACLGSPVTVPSLHDVLVGASE